MNLRDLHNDPELLAELIEAEETRLYQLERDRRHGPVVGEDPSVEYELIDPRVRARYCEMEPF